MSGLRATRLPRTGPVGRAARLLLSAFLVYVAFDLWQDRRFIFDPPGSLLDPGLIVLTGAMAVTAYHLGAMLAHRGGTVLIALALLGAAAAAWTVAAAGTLWAGPFTWLVWGLDFGFAVVIALLLVIAIGVGTPGCEVGLLRRLGRGGDDGRPVTCIVGLHAIDAWERRRSWAREP